MRIGEILGLQWDHVFCSDEEIEQGLACVKIDRELKRCQASCLDALEGRGRSKIIFRFPEQKKTCTTALVLKQPKTASSVRTVFLAKTVALALQKEKER